MKKGQLTAKQVKRMIWMNISLASGDEITINREYLSYLLEELETSQYDTGYSDGYDHSSSAFTDNLPIRHDFEGEKKEW